MNEERRGENIIEWSVDEYIFEEKSVDWFWALGIGALALAIASIIFKNYLFAVVIILGAITLGLLALRLPRHINCAVKEKGVLIDETFYPFDSLQSFSIADDGPIPKLILISTKTLVPHIIVPLSPYVDAEELDLTLRQKIRRGNHREPLTNILVDRLGF